MSGGLMQLVAIGEQDKYLTGNPEITFFKSIQKKHTNFAIESIEQTINGSMKKNNRVTCNISRNGDLVSNVWIEEYNKRQHSPLLEKFAESIKEWSDIPDVDTVTIGDDDYPNYETIVNAILEAEENELSDTTYFISKTSNLNSKKAYLTKYLIEKGIHKSVNFSVDTTGSFASDIEYNPTILTDKTKYYALNDAAYTDDATYFGAIDSLITDDDGNYVKLVPPSTIIALDATHPLKDINNDGSAVDTTVLTDADLLVYQLERLQYWHYKFIKKMLKLIKVQKHKFDSGTSGSGYELVKDMWTSPQSPLYYRTFGTTGNQDFHMYLLAPKLNLGNYADTFAKIQKVHIEHHVARAEYMWSKTSIQNRISEADGLEDILRNPLGMISKCMPYTFDSGEVAVNVKWDVSDVVKVDAGSSLTWDMYMKGIDDEKYFLYHPNTVRIALTGNLGSKRDLIQKFERISVEIGGTTIDRHTSEFIELACKMNSTSSNYGHLLQMQTQNMDFYIGDDMLPEEFAEDVSDSGVGTAVLWSTPSSYRRFPLQFWFNKHISQALPLIALQYHEVKLNFKLSDKFQDNTSFRVFADYIYLDTDERSRFARQPHEYLIEQVQNTGKESVSTNSISKIRLDFNHPVKQLIWSLYDQYNNNISDGLESAKLLLNGHDRFIERDAVYFRDIQPFMTDQIIKHENNYEFFFYSFALEPLKLQPSGTCNFSRIDNATLQLECKGEASKAEVYAINYNVLRIKNGMGGLTYSN